MNKKPNSILWTRPRDSWERDKTLLAEGLGPLWPQVIHIPCTALSKRSLPPQQLAWLTSLEKNPVACLWTSANSVRFALEQGEGLLKPLISQSLNLCVGQQTLKALQSHGLLGFHPKGVFDGDSLCAYVIGHVDPSQPILCFGGEVRAHHSVEFLLQAGFTAHRLDVYATEIAVTNTDGTPLTPDLLAHYEKTWQGYVCFFSPSAVAGFLKIIQKTQRLTAVTIGATTGKACEGHFERVLVAPTPELREVVSLLQKEYFS